MAADPPRPEPRQPVIVVIGASAGGVEALQALVAELPEGLEAALFVVLHLPEEGTSTLPSILNRAGRLPAAHAADAEHIRPGRIYVAAPGRHLLVSPDRVRLSAGPKENGHRPAIDPLFRSAASAHSDRVVAVLLSGTLDDGTAGFHSVKHAGGITLVQDPEEAAYRGMIDNALQGAPVDAVLGIKDLAAEVERLVGVEDPAQGFDRTTARPLELQLEQPPQTTANPGRAERSSPIDAEPSPTAAGHARTEDPPGTPSPLTCPECNGVLWDVSEGNLVRFRCRVGHAYNGHTLDSEQAKTVEASLWQAARMLEERAVLLDRLAGRMRTRNHVWSAQRLSSRAEEALHHAGVIRSVLTGDASADMLIAEDDPPDEEIDAMGIECSGDNGDR